MDPTPFLRGVAFPATRSVPYPRAQPGDIRLPGDTWYTATFPIGVRLEVTGDAEAVDISYRCTGNDMTWQSELRAAFESWRGDERLGIAEADQGEGTVRLPVQGSTVIYLPERLKPQVTDIEPIGGALEPVPNRPRWICYGDSIAAGQMASSPALGWAALVARRYELDVFNMGYSGAARGELATAEQIAALDAAVISITHGTNCWNRLPFSESLMRENTIAFLRLVRAGHPDTPIVVGSPPLRPEAENTSNALGATLGDLRRAMAEAAKAFDGVRFIDGATLITGDMLHDNVHPNDAGHATLADALGTVIAEAAGG